MVHYSRHVSVFTTVFSGRCCSDSNHSGMTLVYKTILFETSCRGDRQDLVAEYVAEAKDGGFKPSGKGYRSFLHENGHTWAKNKSTKELQCKVDRYMRLADMREDESQPTDFSD